MTEELRKRMREIALTRDNTNRIAALPKGNAHWNFSKNPSVLTLHKRLHRSLGKASQFPCADNCGRMARDWSNETGNYTDDPKDYRPRCRSCHVKRDKNWLKGGVKQVIPSVHIGGLPERRSL